LFIWGGHPAIGAQLNSAKQKPFRVFNRGVQKKGLNLNKDARIYIAGHTGLVGSSICRNLSYEGYSNLLVQSHKELDLCRQKAVEVFFRREKPQFVIMAAAKVGGIWANNTWPADFIYSNLVIQSNIIQTAWKEGVERLLFLGSSCIYPRDCPQPMKERFLLSGPLEVTNEPYALAKIAGIKMCQSYNRQHDTRFYSIMPTNLFGPNDNFDLETSHVLPALIRKFHEAKINGKKSVEIWGSGTPRREFLHVDDLADACLFIMNLEEERFRSLLAEEFPLINVGWGKDISIGELAALIKKAVGFNGGMVFDAGKPDGTPQKLLDTSKLNALGWAPRITLEEGIVKTYGWCLENSVF
jgi:GDP-L-fucose synthase